MEGKNRIRYTYRSCWALHSGDPFHVTSYVLWQVILPVRGYTKMRRALKAWSQVFFNPVSIRPNSRLDMQRGWSIMGALIRLKRVRDIMILIRLKRVRDTMIRYTTTLYPTFWPVSILLLLLFFLLFSSSSIFSSSSSFFSSFLSFFSLPNVHHDWPPLLTMIHAWFSPILAGRRS